MNLSSLSVSQLSNFDKNKSQKNSSRYSVYQLEEPIVEHAVYLQVYEKRALANGSTYWENLTGDSVVR